MSTDVLWFRAKDLIKNRESKKEGSNENRFSLGFFDLIRYDRFFEPEGRRNTEKGN
ncbi:MAG: hypothetical protein SFU91_02210 [Chloroherpetonaceae bacterium]|nr:hypothetical protein [Chloroherpetonaceae bacterium]